MMRESERKSKQVQMYILFQYTLSYTNLQVHISRTHLQVTS